MLEFQPAQRYYLVSCDHCEAQDTIKTAASKQQAAQIAARWGWAIGDAEGDLCPRCVKLRKTLKTLSPSPAAQAAPAPAPAPAPATSSAHPTTDRLWARLFLDESPDDEQNSPSGRPVCERCGRQLAWTTTPHEAGIYLCERCARKLDAS